MAQQQVVGLDRHAVRSSPQSAVPATRAILEILFGPPRDRSFAVKLWDGTVEAPPAGTPIKFTLILNRPGALRRILWPPTDLVAGEAYLRNDFDVDGDMIEMTGLSYVIAQRLRSPLALARVMAHLRHLPTDDLPVTALPSQHAVEHQIAGVHTRRRDAGDIHYHYDVGNDFYALWLDRQMVYSCAYFATGTETLDEAQAAKLDLICRKLRLQEGETLLDIGCGWGALVMHAARYYGVQATGITLSEQQVVLARQRIEAAGLADRCRVELRDYRDLPRHARFDKIVSVGMVEHVGSAHLPTYFATAHRVLKPGGLFLNHGIVSRAPRPSAIRRVGRHLLAPHVSFIQRYVFPDGELVTPGESVQYAEAAGFETRDVESLREHYALTLRHWVQRLEAHHDQVVALTDETTYRIWRLYMAASSYAFATDHIGITQMLFSKPDETGHTHLPLTRADLYR